MILIKVDICSLLKYYILSLLNHRSEIIVEIMNHPSANKQNAFFTTWHQPQFLLAPQLSGNPSGPIYHHPLGHIGGP